MGQVLLVALGVVLAVNALVLAAFLVHWWRQGRHRADHEAAERSGRHLTAVRPAASDDEAPRRRAAGGRR
ncbi:hypothetical protein SK069_18270 [Patulibacter brassicae]|jgi:hypothetical protein|uniref:Uncharacterized protein n=1 Tax=Patulibacter brassicae TaxID=1705717 RepID=A0ABU4VNX5_9ACTN|nr:hypothetical protein [Patulibacter brassicae]MDX8153551.1 hypothetical protein [Patulibacter brassicae]